MAQEKLETRWKKVLGKNVRYTLHLSGQRRVRGRERGERKGERKEVIYIYIYIYIYSFVVFYFMYILGFSKVILVSLLAKIVAY